MGKIIELKNNFFAIWHRPFLNVKIRLELKTPPFWNGLREHFYVPFFVRKSYYIFYKLLDKTVKKYYN